MKYKVGQKFLSGSGKLRTIIDRKVISATEVYTVRLQGASRETRNFTLRDIDKVLQWVPLKDKLLTLRRLV